MLLCDQAGDTAFADAHGGTGSALRLSLRSLVEASRASGALSAQLLLRDDQAVPTALQKVRLAWASATPRLSSSCLLVR